MQQVAEKSVYINYKDVSMALLSRNADLFLALSFIYYCYLEVVLPKKIGHGSHNNWLLQRIFIYTILHTHQFLNLIGVIQ